jgi:hypothetical protein
VLIAGLGVTSVLLLDALTFLISAWLIASVRRALSEGGVRRRRGDEEEPDAPPEREGGPRHMLADRPLRALILRRTPDRVRPRTLATRVLIRLAGDIRPLWEDPTA